jgi:hypothetical protein
MAATLLALRCLAGAIAGAVCAIVPTCDRGEKGPKGDKGDRGLAAPAIIGWQIDRASFTATPVMTDGSEGPPLELRGLFEQYQIETG